MSEYGDVRARAPVQAELRSLLGPTIFITAHGHEKMRLPAMRDGAVKFLMKPFEGETLLEAIRMTGSLTEAQTARLLFQCLQHA